MLARNLRRFLAFIGFAVLTIVFLNSFGNIDALQFTNIRFNSDRYPSDTCTPEAYASGSWSYHPIGQYSKGTVMKDPKDALSFSGFQNCASSREFTWHLASDKPEQYDRFPGAQSYQWIPGKGCERMVVPSSEELVKHLVNDGGWYLVGDSVTENHFFSMSCMLYPHVFATPDYTSLTSFDRGWPQNLYLSPSSPLFSSLSPPNGFNASTMPLVTFRRIDILFSTDELIDLHRKTKLRTDNAPPLFSEELVWSLPLSEYLDEFLSPLLYYGTMVVSTGGHWTTTLFSGAVDFSVLNIRDGSQEQKATIQAVLELFEGAVQVWTRRVQDALTTYSSHGNSISRSIQKPSKRVLIRPYLPGHEDCHSFREPWTEIQSFVWNWYNWGEIWRFNKVFQDILSSRNKFPDIFYLSIDRPARLRPDAHASGDCLHIMSGAGVLEGWTNYIWHFVTEHA